KERENLTTLARSCAGVGSALITIITMKCVLTLGAGDERVGFKLFALIIAILFIVLIAFACITIKEKSTVNVNTPTVGQMFKALIQNDQAMTVVIAIVLINCSLYITSNLLIYFFKYDVAGTGWADAYTLFNAFGGGIQIISMMIFFPLIRHFLSTTKVFYTSLVLAMAGYGILLVFMISGIKTLFALFVPGFLIFSAFGMLTVLTTVFLANTVDYGELRNNRRDESVIFSMQTFVVKLSSGIAALIASICLSLFHINDSTDAVVTAAASESSLMGLRMTMTILPIIGMIAAVLVFRKKFILTEAKVDEITDTLKHREGRE
ncbi:MAG: MFS transporter, partial [Bacillota bacterium]